VWGVLRAWGGFVGGIAPPVRRDRASARPYARGPFHSHVGPMTCTWALSPARKPDDMHAGNPDHVHVEGLMCASRG